MIELKIEPHIGIGPIKLGASRHEARAALSAIGLPLEAADKNLDYFDRAGIKVEYTSDCASFIGVSHSKVCLFTYFGKNVFDTPATELFELFASNEATGNHVFNTYEHVFPEQILTLWDADEQYDRIGMETRVMWAQVGVGNGVYLRAIRRIGGEAV
ncbi:MAG: hypothetical protein QM776_15550 [Rhodocyclaceae bacterium]